MKNLSVSIILILIGAIPIGISAFNYINSAGLQWPMIWQNEATIWGCIFSVFPIVGIGIATVNKRVKKYSLMIILIFALIIIFPSYYNFFVNGIGQSSKQDSSTINLIEYWTSGWWK
jgi:hypothetical protein